MESPTALLALVVAERFGQPPIVEATHLDRPLDVPLYRRGHKARPGPTHLIPADPVRTHLARLRRHYILPEIAAMTGLPTSSLQALWCGRHRCVHRATATALLAVPVPARPPIYNPHPRRHRKASHPRRPVTRRPAPVEPPRAPRGYDWVKVDRAVSGLIPARLLSPQERAEAVRRLARGKRLTDQQIAEVLHWGDTRVRPGQRVSPGAKAIRDLRRARHIPSSHMEGTR